MCGVSQGEKAVPIGRLETIRDRASGCSFGYCLPVCLLKKMIVLIPTGPDSGSRNGIVLSSQHTTSHSDRVIELT